MSTKQSLLADTKTLDELTIIDPQPVEAEVSWIGRLQQLWESRVLLWRFTWMGSLAGLLAAFVLPVRYDSTAKLMPPDNPNMSGMAMISALAGKASGALGLGTELLGIQTPSAVFVEILKSRTVQDELINRFDLRKVYWDRYMEDARKDLAKNTDVSEDHKSEVVTITVTDKDPKRAAYIAEAYVDSLNRLVAELSTSSARRERMFIEERLNKVRTDLTASAQRFSQFASTSGAIDIKEQTKSMLEAAAVLEGQLIAAQSDLEALQQVYAPNNIRIRSAQARVQELRRELERIGGVEASAPRITADTSTKEMYPSIRQLPVLGVEWADLYRQNKIEETVYELLNQEYELAKIQEAKEIPTVKVLEAPVVATKRSSPHRVGIMLMATVLSLFLGILFIFGHAWWAQLPESDSRKMLCTRIFFDVFQSIPFRKSRLLKI